MLSHEIVRAIEQDRQRAVEASLGRPRPEGPGGGHRARVRAALLRWLGAAPSTQADRPNATTTRQAVVKTRNA
jgi:hypothetical protein